MYKLQLSKFEDIRIKNKLSMEALAKKCGISLMTYRRLKDGKDTHLSTLIAISNYFKKEIGYWFEEYKPENMLSEPDQNYGCSVCNEKNKLIEILKEDREILKKTNEALRKCMDHLPVEKKH